MVPVLEVDRISKTFGPVHALSAVSLTLQEGEVRALLGKNGAGKSTLVNIISGSVSPDPDGGRLLMAGSPTRWTGPAAARDGGIAVVHQELSLVPRMSVAENITLGQWPRRRNGLLDVRQRNHMAAEALDILGEPLPLFAEVGRLPLAQQQLTEIAKALLLKPRVLILDEPTSALNASEADALLRLVRRLAGQGVAVIYVSHRMQEIPKVADTMTILRDGLEIATIDARTASVDTVASLISGQDQAAPHGFPPRDATQRAAALSVRGLSLDGVFDDVSFDVHEGEVLGIAGLLGSGRTEILECVFGTRHDVAGEVLVNGQSVTRRTPISMIAKGVGLAPEDRRGSGLFELLSVAENLVATARGRNIGRGWIDVRGETRAVADHIAKLAIQTASPSKEIRTLSGGNQQKVVLGRLLAANLRVLLLDEPTRGIDVHAKSQLYAIVRELADRGVSTVFVSSEIEELTEVCDRILVLRNGRITDDLFLDETSSEMLLALTMKDD